MTGEKSLYQICQDATAATIGTKIGEYGFSIDEAVRNVREMTSAVAWNRETLFDFVIRSYIAACAHEAGYRSVIKRRGVYANKDIFNKGVRLELIKNARKEAQSREEVAEELQQSYEIRFCKESAPGQLAFDANTGSIYEEVSSSELIDIIRQLETA